MSKIYKNGEWNKILYAVKKVFWCDNTKKASIQYYIEEDKYYVFFNEDEKVEAESLGEAFKIFWEKAKLPTDSEIKRESSFIDLYMVSKAY